METSRKTLRWIGESGNILQREETVAQGKGE